MNQIIDNCLDKLHKGARLFVFKQTEELSSSRSLYLYRKNSKEYLKYEGIALEQQLAVFSEEEFRQELQFLFQTYLATAPETKISGIVLELDSFTYDVTPVLDANASSLKR